MDNTISHRYKSSSNLFNNMNDATTLPANLCYDLYYHYSYNNKVDFINDACKVVETYLASMRYLHGFNNPRWLVVITMQKQYVIQICDDVLSRFPCSENIESYMKQLGEF